MTESLSFDIRSADGALLALGPADPDVYSARITAPGLSAQVAVFHYRGDRLDEFFAGLARDWRGWDGERGWRCLEAALAIGATISRAGAITLRVELRNSPKFTWQVTYDFIVENGSLDGIATGASRFVECLGRPRDSRRAHV